MAYKMYRPKSAEGVVTSLTGKFEFVDAKSWLKKHPQKFRLHIRELKRPIEGYKYEVYGGTVGGRYLSTVHKSKAEATKYKEALIKTYKKTPWLISFRASEY